MTTLSNDGRVALDILLKLYAKGHLERLRVSLGGQDEIVSATYKDRTFTSRNGDDGADEDDEASTNADAALVRVLNDVIDAAKVTLGDANSVLRITGTKP